MYTPRAPDHTYARIHITCIHHVPLSTCKHHEQHVLHSHPREWQKAWRSHLSSLRAEFPHFRALDQNRGIPIIYTLSVRSEVNLRKIPRVMLHQYQRWVPCGPTQRDSDRTKCFTPSTSRNVYISCSLALVGEALRKIRPACTKHPVEHVLKIVRSAHAAHPTCSSSWGSYCMQRGQPGAIEEHASARSRAFLTFLRLCKAFEVETSRGGTAHRPKAVSSAYTMHCISDNRMR